MFQPPASAEDIPTVDELIAVADKTVAGLEMPKRRLAWALRRHLVAAVGGERTTLPNLMIMGPTGGGKTHLVTTMLKAAPVIYGEANATEYSDVGYLGRDLNTMYANLITKKWAGEKKPEVKSWSQAEIIGLAQRFGVILLDEFDKLRMTSKPGERQVGRALQAELLKLTEGADIEVKRFDGDRGFSFRTHRVLHIATGAFEGIETTMIKEDGPDPATRHDIEGLHMNVAVHHLAKYGFLPELLGRFNCIIPLPKLDHDAVQRIVEEQALPRYEREFALHGLGLEVEPGALAWICGQVLNHGQSGARAINALLEELTWYEASMAPRGSTVALTTASVHERHSEIREKVMA